MTTQQGVLWGRFSPVPQTVAIAGPGAGDILGGLIMAKISGLFGQMCGSQALRRMSHGVSQVTPFISTLKPEIKWMVPRPCAN